MRIPIAGATGGAAGDKVVGRGEEQNRRRHLFDLGFTAAAVTSDKKPRRKYSQHRGQDKSARP